MFNHRWLSLVADHEAVNRMLTALVDQTDQKPRAFDQDGNRFTELVGIQLNNCHTLPLLVDIVMKEYHSQLVI